MKCTERYGKPFVRFVLVESFQTQLPTRADVPLRTG